jgi:hypothetical protein
MSDDESTSIASGAIDTSPTVANMSVTQISYAIADNLAVLVELLNTIVRIYSLQQNSGIFHEMLETNGQSMKRQLKEIAFSAYKTKLNNTIQ